MSFRSKSTKEILHKSEQKDPIKMIELDPAQARMLQKNNSMQIISTSRQDRLRFSSIITESPKFYHDPQIKRPKGRSVDEKLQVCSFQEDNPFGFTPYDSGKLLGNYGFNDTVVKTLSEVMEEP
uniref:Uncharacterized protein n=1 Tax=Euplotes crassus TaxID=5936 RepID=A0A7S3KHW2_EUPCR|mmetsp:Transcript_25081/g.24832  ORF Transcript_25081/g.24832 Transcript_25081/m.24832 type:complete len:124 (+) Transcript_25081:343-714(+)